MKVNSLVRLTVLAFLVSACSASTVNPPAAVSQAPATPVPYPGPTSENPLPTLDIYPAPMIPAPNVQLQSPEGYAPQPGDTKLSRDNVIIDMAGSQVVMQGVQNNEPAVSLVGELSDPCHHLRIVVSSTDSQNSINLEVYSVYDPQMMCTMVIQPFQVTVSLGSFPAGHYTVYVNGQLLGEFDQ